MKERLSQIIAVVLYEMLIQWRRKGLPLVLACLITRSWIRWKEGG
jgi:hypothetical protein